jgi:hypothetical protein
VAIISLIAYCALATAMPYPGTCTLNCASRLVNKHEQKDTYNDDAFGSAEHLDHFFDICTRDAEAFGGI